MPVLLGEVLDLLAPSPGGRFVDGTLGAGGHAEALLHRILPGGRLLGIDRDPEALAAARPRLAAFGDAAVLVRADFRDIERVAREHGFGDVDGVLLDVGVSSMQLDAPGRGFSFRREEVLDMRMSPDLDVSAEDLVNGLPEKELADLIWQGADERHSRRIARAIVTERRRRRIRTTTELADLVARAIPGRRGRLHPATRTFQALRVAVNSEFEALEDGLRGAAALLRPGGRFAVLTFHSHESRRVKTFFRDEERAGRLRRLTRHAVTASDAERRANPRSRSAELRAALRPEGPDEDAVGGVS